MDKLRSFLGLPVNLSPTLKLNSPTIRSIAEIGEGVYNFYLSLATFNKDSIVSALFNLSDEEMEKVQLYDDYDFLVATPLLKDIENALSFFSSDKVEFFDGVFYIRNEILVSKENYRHVSEIIRELNGIREQENKKLKFRNKKAEQNYYLMLEMQKKYEKQEELSLKDYCSILCNAEGNGISVFNIGELTIYQVLEHFERLSVKESHRRMLQVWANGHLKEDVKLQEWLIKTKL